MNPEAAEVEAPSKRKSQATKLVALARQDDTDLFHDEAGKPYITFTNGTHQETWPLTSTALRDWLSARYYAAYDTVPGSQALKDALNTLSGIARFKGSADRSMCDSLGTRVTSISTSATPSGRLSTFPQRLGHCSRSNLPGPVPAPRRAVAASLPHPQRRSLGAPDAHQRQG